MHVQLTQQLRSLILSGRIGPGARLPSSRALAADLGVSRLTVTTSMDQLVAEGYVRGEHGRGLFVEPNLPDSALKASPAPQPIKLDKLVRSQRRELPFRPGAHDQRLFPHAEWARLLQKCWQSEAAMAQDSANPCGNADLREAVAMHLHEWRGLRCQPQQVLVTAGAADAVSLLVRALRLAGEKVVLEDPGYPLFKDELSLSGVKTLHQRIDHVGIDPAALPPARMAIVTPSRHYPVGTTMPLARRLDLLAWAKAHDALVVEDDFDSEYRYRGTPLPALMGLSDSESVIYMGSFSQVFSPSVRLGYLVVPEGLVADFGRALEARGTQASSIVQAPLARFIKSGRFGTHIRRMRRIFAARQQALLNSLNTHLNGMLHAEAEAGGMHLTVRMDPSLSARMSDVEVSAAGSGAGLTLPALSRYCALEPAEQGLLMGYCGFDEDEMEAACIALAKLLKADAVRSSQVRTIRQ